MQSLIVMLFTMMLTQTITWSTKTPIPQPLAGSACAVINDTVYVIGGRDSGGTRYATNYMYDPVSDSWSAKTEMSTPRAHISCGVVNGKIYVIGGWVGGAQTDTNLVEEYDPTTDSWTTKTSMLVSRYVYALGVVSGKIYVIGGMLPITNVVEEYDPFNDTWTTKTPMPTARMGMGYAVINDMIYVYGGQTQIGQLTPIHECYDPVADTWTTKAAIPTRRYCIGGFAYNDKAYAVGGYDNGSYHTTVELYDPVGDSWSTETPMQYSRQSVAVGLVQDKVYIIGGWNNGALNYNEEGVLGTGIEEEQRIQNMRIEIGPNPFSTSTRIRMTFPNMDAHRNCELKIFDISGRLVRTIELTRSGVIGRKITAEWDGKSDNGNFLPSGAYVLMISSEGIKQTRKILLIK